MGDLPLIVQELLDTAVTDRHARTAARGYANSLRASDPVMAEAIINRLNATPRS